MFIGISLALGVPVFFRAVATILLRNSDGTVIVQSVESWTPRTTRNADGTVTVDQ